MGSFVSLAKSALRGRRRQYEARARLEELNALAAELEQRVEQRTAERETAMAQLHEAQKLETLGQLTGGVAHDFNNLLTPITGALDLLQRKYGNADERSDRLLSNALQAADRAKTLLQRLLGFARRQALQTGPVDIGALLAGMRDLISSSVGPTIDLHVRHDPELPSALIDCQSSAAAELFDQLRDIAHDVARQFRLGKHVESDDRVSPVGRVDQRPFGEVANHPAASSSSCGRSSINSGTPRSTPWKPISGSPSVTRR